MSNLPPFESLEHYSGDPDRTKKLKEMLGPLYGFLGEWESDPNMGWNVITIPGPFRSDLAEAAAAYDKKYKYLPGFNDGKGFMLLTIPYYEKLTIKPISLTKNNGQFSEGNPKVQQIGGVVYEQEIYSSGLEGLNDDYPFPGDDPKKNEIRENLEAFFKNKKFLPNKKGAKPMIHKEVGMMLYLKDQQMYKQKGDKFDERNEKYSIARMGTIPHGNTMLCLGEHLKFPSDVSYNFEEKNLSPEGNIPPGYFNGTYELEPQAIFKSLPFYQNPKAGETFGSKDFLNPNNPYRTLKRASSKLGLKHSCYLNMSTKRGSGGLLSVPFLTGGRNPGQDATAIDTTYMDSEYWLSKDNNEKDYLQYFQNIGLNFPTTGGIEQIKWPHLGLNTLRRVLLK